MKNAEAPVIQKEVLRDKIFELLKQWILDGTLQPGERIVEYVLARKINVSRAPVREALWLLSHQGLVELRAHHGAFVTQLSVEDLIEIFEIREVLETYAAKRIRATMTSDKKQRLVEALQALEQAAASRDVVTFSEADLEFHKTLWQLAGNRLLPDMLGEVSARFFYKLYRDVAPGSQLRFDEMVEEHRTMVGVILGGTDQEIEASFEQAFAVFRAYVLERLDEAGDATG